MKDKKREGTAYNVAFQTIFHASFYYTIIPFLIQVVPILGTDKE